jgi:hypothetical protein
LLLYIYLILFYINEHQYDYTGVCRQCITRSRARSTVYFSACLTRTCVILPLKKNYLFHLLLGFSAFFFVFFFFFFSFLFNVHVASSFMQGRRQLAQALGWPPLAQQTRRLLCSGATSSSTPPSPRPTDRRERS